MRSRELWRVEAQVQDLESGARVRYEQYATVGLHNFIEKAGNDDDELVQSDECPNIAPVNSNDRQGRTRKWRAVVRTPLSAFSIHVGNVDFFNIEKY
jgi:hypothetical protein